jgi:murein DD-endopeptidase MepM/ murein hydrolase activator NlpD
MKAPTAKLLSPERIWESRQGDTLLVFFQADKPIQRAEVEVVRDPSNQRVRLPASFFEAAPQVYCLLRPIDIETPPAEYTDRFLLYDQAGNEVVLSQRTRILKKQPREGEVNLTEGILQKLGVKTLEEQEEMRKRNNARITELTSKFSPERHFSGPFIRPAQGTWTSPYGQRRLYNGKVWHRHLGMDLADVSNAPVFAANDGVVALAEPLGIYGNCILLDHGRGIFTLYGHNASLNVKAGDKVKKGQTIAIQGDTGLAGGIHLHLSFVVGTVYVAPDIFIQKFEVFERELASALGPNAPPAGQPINPAASVPQATGTGDAPPAPASPGTP